MLEGQIKYFDRAVSELIETIGVHLNKFRDKKGLPNLKYSYLFLLDGKRVINLLDIPSDAAVLVCTDKDEIKGLDFEEMDEPEDAKKSNCVVGEFIQHYSSKFANR
jgi:hypothetical protein